MGSIAERVAALLDGDSVVQEALRRGIVNRRALARWMIDSHGWEASEEAVVSAIRRYGDAIDDSVHREAMDPFPDAQLSMHGNMSLLVLRRGAPKASRLASLFDLELENGGAIRVIQAGEALTVIVDEANRGRVEDTLGTSRIKCSLSPATELHVTFPCSTLETPGVLSMILNRLASRRINVLGVGTAAYECVVFVAQRDGIGAYDELARLIETAE